MFSAKRGRDLKRVLRHSYPSRWLPLGGSLPMIGKQAPSSQRTDQGPLLRGTRWKSRPRRVNNSVEAVSVHSDHFRSLLAPILTVHEILFVLAKCSVLLMPLLQRLLTPVQNRYDLRTYP